MIYQLPNGKIINITVEQYLELSDSDIDYLVSINFGDFPSSHNPFDGSVIGKTRKNKIFYNDLDHEEENDDNVSIPGTKGNLSSEELDEDLEDDAGDIANS